MLSGLPFEATDSDIPGVTLAQHFQALVSWCTAGFHSHSRARARVWHAKLDAAKVAMQQLLNDRHFYGSYCELSAYEWLARQNGTL